LSRTTIKSWKDLAEAFIKQYQYNLDLAPNRTLLQGMSQTAKETFREYAQRWRQIVASVQPPMSEREMADMFMNTLQGNYIERLAACPSISFAEIVIAGERIESLLKMGRIQDNSASNRLLVTISEEKKARQALCMPAEAGVKDALIIIKIKWPQSLFQHLLLNSNNNRSIIRNSNPGTTINNKEVIRVSRDTINNVQGRRTGSSSQSQCLIQYYFPS
jgi:hypothetical protein